MIAATVTDIKHNAIDSMSPSRPVSSNQAHTHPGLAATVRKHLTTAHRKPVADHDRAALQELQGHLANDPRPLVLDSFCGTGQSTALLASRHPAHLVVGVDKSANRLGRHSGSDGDYLLLQADCPGLWALLAQAGLGVDFHYLLYPNPWPKSRHLQRRVHGHPGFAALLQLGGLVELRSNWQLYVEEFGLAMQLAGHPGRVFRLPQPGNAPDMTLFERKYRLSGHALWAFQVNLDPREDVSGEPAPPRQPP
jgi:tRNA (guanine-N7-)-methyltransferase